jgi:protein O-mannosyl-transferase
VSAHTPLPATTPGTPRLPAAVGLLLALAVGALAYAPGLAGPFLFDDVPNLHRLQALNEAATPERYAQYVLDGKASVLGRPLSLLSFAVQHRSWPERPGDFLAVNLALHLLNAALWFALVARLQRLRLLPDATLLPAAAAALWLLLPVHGSAVLYVVQRMTLLATTFMLAGLLLYLAGRATAAARPLRGYALMASGLGVGAGLGVLAKESAALLPALILVLEGTLLAALPRPPRWRLAAAALLWLPTAALAAWIALDWPTLLAQYQTRPFTPAQRLLTEARLMFDYLAVAVVPSPAGIRFHYDDFALSKSLLDPWTTAVAIAAWMALAVAALVWRRRAPVFAFAAGWYLVGHALESTVLPLELAFVHRNYVPTLGLSLAACAALVHLQRDGRLARLRRPLAALGGVYLLALAAAMALSAALWSRPLEQAAYWVQRQPDSRRAVYHYGDLLLSQGQPAAAAGLYRGARARWPDDAVLALALFNLRCRLPDAGPDAHEAAAALARYDGSASIRVAGMLQGLAESFERGHCPGLDPRQAVTVTDAALASPWLAPMQLTLQYAAALQLWAAGDPLAALARLEQAIAVEPRIPLLQRAVEWSLRLDDVPRARGFLALAESSPRIPEAARRLWREQIQASRAQVEGYEALRGPRG